MLYTGVFSDTPTVSEQQQGHNTALECSFTLIYSLFQKTDSESKRIFQKARKNIVKGKRIIAECITPPCHHCILGSIQTLPQPGSSKRHLFPDLQTQRIPSLHRALDQLCKASGRLLCWPSSSQHCQTHISPAPELLGQVQCHTKPWRNSTSNHIPVHKSHFSL